MNLFKKITLIEFILLLVMAYFVYVIVIPGIRNIIKYLESL